MFKKNVKKANGITIAFLVMVLSCCRGGSSDGEDEKDRGSINVMSSEQLSAEIDKVTIQSVALKDVEIQTALDFLVKRGSEAHPNHPFHFPFDRKAVASDNDATVTFRGGECSVFRIDHTCM